MLAVFVVNVQVGAPPLDLLRVGDADVQHAAAEVLRGHADDPSEDAHQQVIGRQQQAAEDQADGQDVGADAGEVHFQQSPAGRPQVAARADHRPGRKLRHGHRGQGGEADQRQEPSGQAEDRLAHPAPGQEHGVQRRQRDQQVIGPQAQGGEQQPADQAPERPQALSTSARSGKTSLLGGSAGS